MRWIMEQQTTTKVFYNHVALKYKTSLPVKHLINPDSRTIIPEIDLFDGMRLLDVACGNGKLLFTISGIISESELHGVDSAKSKIDRNIKTNSNSNIHFQTASPDNLPFDNNYFDVLTCANSVHNFPQKVRAIDEMHRVLKIGGQLYILEAIRSKKWKQKFDKTLRQTMFIQPRKKYLSRSSIFCRSYLIVATK
ncbi:methyltransferase domain-containing protein [candidate division KSB1 bacterium]|nr:methyltransferase domain-containing protein [candidate division KSB1 bacterium]